MLNVKLGGPPRARTVKEKIKLEVERVKKFQQVVLGIKAKVSITDIDIRNYAKYVLQRSPRRLCPFRAEMKRRLSLSAEPILLAESSPDAPVFRPGRALREGKDVEKRELLGCLRGKIELKNKIITL